MPTPPPSLLTPPEVPTPGEPPDFEYEAEDTAFCTQERDLGLIDAITQSKKVFCASDASGTIEARDTTKIALYRASGGIAATVLTNLQLKLTSAEVFSPINDISDDGCDHDPRFTFTPDMVRCRCSEIGAYARAHGGAFNQVRKIWGAMFAEVDSEEAHISRVCDPSSAALDSSSHSNDIVSSANVLDIHDPVIAIARRDDHNPFFQVSSALNAWVVAKALGWDLSRTRVLHLDAGYPTPVDELHERLLSSGSTPIIRGQELVGKVVHFHSSVLLVPPENTGPMMQHLDDEEPCRKSQLFLDFRAAALQAMGVSDVVRTSPRARPPVLVTIISRRHYDGRKLQRIWVNEDSIVSRMRHEYADLRVTFQSVDFVHLPMAQQMQTILRSDVVVGMHGAGMVNVFWAQPETLVVEIFPKQRYRWGYRNLCQFLGCDWHEFRGGADYGGGRDANAKDKLLDYVEWMQFFDPLLRKRYSKVVEVPGS